MVIAKDLSSLPSARADVGVPPATSSPFMKLVMELWAREYIEAHDMPAAIPELPFRASDVSKRCDRALAYSIAQVERDGEMSPASAWRFWLGETVHNELRKIIVAHASKLMELTGYRLEAEVEVDLRPMGIEGSAHADYVAYKDGAPTIVVEVKSQPGFAFKQMATTFKGPPAGPRDEHVSQGALIAKALGAPYVLVVYLALEGVSPKLVASFSGDEFSRFLAEWKFTVDELDGAIEFEVGRVGRLVRLVRRGVLPDRALAAATLPSGAVIDNPRRGSWVTFRPDDKGGTKIDRSGTIWYCDYCDYRERCLDDGDGQVEGVLVGNPHYRPDPNQQEEAT